jgi:Ca-activated chloride channel family protein
MTFTSVKMLYFIWVLPLFLLAYAYGWRKRKRILTRFAGRYLLPQLVPVGITVRRRWKAALVTAAGLLTIVALAGPRYGFHWQEIHRRGVDIVIALDCSRSMLATDIQPTRLDRAKREIYDLLTMLQGDRVGLVAFSGTAFLQCPLTVDYPALYLFLDVLAPDYLPVGGSDMTAALTAAREAFDTESAAEKAVILITDGEHTGRQDPQAAARQIAQSGITLFCIGVGSAEGVPLPEPRGGFKKDASGQIVLSRIDETLLSRMALATGGSYVRSVAGDMDLDTIYHQQIRGRMEDAAVESGRKQVWADRFQWPLTLAVAFLLAVLWVPPEKRGLMALWVAVAMAAAPAPANAGPLQSGYDAYREGAYDRALERFVEGQLDDPDNPSILYNLGNAYYKTGDYKAAWDHFAQALTHAPADLKSDLLYNMGNSAYRQGNLQDAIDHYRAALNLTPEDIQAKENLAFVQEKLKQQQQQQQQQQKDGATSSQKKQAPEQSEADQGNTGEERQPPGSPDQQMAGEPLQTGRPQGPQDDETRPRETFEKELTGNHREQQPGSHSSVEQMLNRLKDQPGRAMMPNYRKRTVDKDW